MVLTDSHDVPSLALSLRLEVGICMVKRMGVAVSVGTRIDVPLTAAVPVFGGIVRHLSNRAEQPADLSIDLASDLQMPIEASLHVKIRVQASECGDHRSFELTLAPDVRHDYYPRFHGWLTLSEAAPSTCSLVLEGAYTVPLGRVGEAIDMTFLRGTAARSLQRFIDRIASDISHCVREEQDEHARALLHFHV